VSVGRQLCIRLIDVAEDLRDYAALVDQFEQTNETRVIFAETLESARRLEGLIPAVLAFEGEALPQLPAGAAS